jgi:hypothetical protein
MLSTIKLMQRRLTMSKIIKTEEAYEDALSKAL